MAILQRRVTVPLPVLILLLIITVAAVAFAVVGGSDDSLSGTLLLNVSIDGNGVVNGLNGRRSSPLSNNGQLASAAQNYANGLANNAPGDVGALIGAAGYQASTWFFANAFAGYDMSVDELLNTLGGYGQLFDATYKDAGVGIVSAGGTNYYVVIVAAPQGGGAQPAGGGGQPPAQPPQTSRADGMLSLVNNLRSQQGACPLTINEQLSNAAIAHSRDMAGMNGNAPFLSHTGSNGSTLGSRAAAAGYAGGTLGENVLLRFDVSDQGAYDQWFNSPGHYQNMINRAFTEIGIAYAGPASDGAYYYTMVLGSTGAGCP